MALYIVIQKKQKIFKQKNVKITKRAHDFKGYSSIDNVDILNHFNTELLLTDTSTAIKNKP